MAGIQGPAEYAPSSNGDPWQRQYQTARSGLRRRLKSGRHRKAEAFHTAKAHGLGIGLAVSRSIIESHKGQLWAMANDGPGATFGFSVPCASGPVIDTAAITAVESQPSGIGGSR
jgi:light-regulated signal transduction histidine kinase (bacteriophytochrome)